jgi:hypothetical protein
MIAPLNTFTAFGMFSSLPAAFEVRDPVLARQLTIDSGDFGGGGGGGRVNFLNPLFPPGGTPRSDEAVLGVIERHDLASRLDAGDIYYSIQAVAGYKVPRLRTIFRLRAPCKPVVQAMRDIDQWEKWMPRFKFSQSRPAGRPGARYQEAKMGVVGVTLQYQILVEGGPFGGGERGDWRIDSTGFKKDMFAAGLEINDGFWAFFPVPGHPEETYAAYAIHTQPSTLLPGMADRIEKSTIKEFPEFPTNLQSVALDSTWTKKRPPIAVGRNFTMREVV